ncbi:MAG: phage tail protein, partial [Holosporales bacterium]
MSLLSEVLANLCQKAGLAPSQVDLSLVTGTIEGFVVSNRASVRSSLEHLQRAFVLDIVESSGKIRFVPRGQAVAATIPINDLIPQGDGNNRELLTITRRQESELSQTLNVNYLSKGADYQQGTQLAQRQVNQAENARPADVVGL